MHWWSWLDPLGLSYEYIITVDCIKSGRKALICFLLPPTCFSILNGLSLLFFFHQPLLHYTSTTLKPVMKGWALLVFIPGQQNSLRSNGKIVGKSFDCDPSQWNVTNELQRTRSCHIWGYLARNPPALPDAAHAIEHRSTRVHGTPSSVRWYATEQPMIPPPTITIFPTLSAAMMTIIV